MSRLLIFNLLYKMNATSKRDDSSKLNLSLLRMALRRFDGEFLITPICHRKIVGHLEHSGKNACTYEKPISIRMKETIFLKHVIT